MSALVYVVLALIAGALVGRSRNDRLPYGVAACALGALVVAVLLSLPLGDLGPHLFEVAPLPAAIGALIGGAAVRLGIGRLVARSG